MYARASFLFAVIAHRVSDGTEIEMLSGTSRKGGIVCISVRLVHKPIGRQSDGTKGMMIADSEDPPLMMAKVPK